MENMVGAFMSNAERFVRWIYPGSLLLVLIHFGSKGGLQSRMDWQSLPEGLKTGAGAVSTLVIFVIVTSFLVYCIHRYLVNELTEYGLYFFGRGPVARQSRNSAACRRRWPHTFWRCNSHYQHLKFGSARDPFLQYLTYGWGVTHAIGVTFWMILLASLLSEKDTTLDRFHVYLWVLAGLLFAVWAWQFGNNNEGDKQFSVPPWEQTVNKRKPWR